MTNVIASIALTVITNWTYVGEFQGQGLTAGVIVTQEIVSVTVTYDKPDQPHITKVVIKEHVNPNYIYELSRFGLLKNQPSWKWDGWKSNLVVITNYLEMTNRTTNAQYWNHQGNQITEEEWQRIYDYYGATKP